MRRYSEEIKDFVAANVEGRTTKELAELVNLKFNTDFTEGKMKAYKANNKLKSGMPVGVPSGMGGKVFPLEVREFIIQNHKGVGPKAMAELVNKTFNTDYKLKQLNAYYKNNHLKSGLTGQFKKGNIPPNKCKKGYHSPGAEKGWFKKGSIPHNNLPIGTELIRDDGYLWRKIADPNVWRQKHFLIWEEANGIVPEGHLITFLDRDKGNITLENLAIITMAESLMMTRSNLRMAEAELTKTGIVIAKLKIARYQRIKSLKKTRGKGENVEN